MHNTSLLPPPPPQVQAVTTDDFVNFATEKVEKKSRVINLSQYGPTYFGPEHAQVRCPLTSSPSSPPSLKGFGSVVRAFDCRFKFPSVRRFG